MQQTRECDPCHQTRLLCDQNPTMVSRILRKQELALPRQEDTTVAIEIVTGADLELGDVVTYQNNILDANMQLTVTCIRDDKIVLMRPYVIARDHDGDHTGAMGFEMIITERSARREYVRLRR